MSAAKVKICGLTNVSDARLAASLGADYLGVILAESPRRVTRECAQEIRAAVPAATLVAVFKDQPIADVVAAAHTCHADLIQLHGAEDPRYCDEVLQRAGKPVVKAFRAVRVPDTSDLARFHTTSYFLFDFDRDAAAEETAAAHAWDDVAAVRRKGFRMFVAGGIDASNVRDILARTNAFAVDVCRGVERAPGRKDPVALAQFMREARE
jgi:phosphoribosylanthranilate isomerase